LEGLIAAKIVAQKSILAVRQFISILIVIVSQKNAVRIQLTELDAEGT
jgi:hypothetical protein